MTTLTTFAKRLNAPARGSVLPALFFLTDETRIGDPLAVISRLPRGSGVIVRDYAAPDRANLVTSIAEISRRRGLRLLVGGDGALARRVGAAGVHLPEHRCREALIWRSRYPSWLVTVAAHSASALHAAGRVGADAALLSPVFATPSHPDGTALGVARFKALARISPVPIVALGGLTGTNICQLAGAAIVGIAAIGGLAEELVDLAGNYKELIPSTTQ